MPGGGKRPGAGARKGNWNALKGGATSPRFMLVYFALLEYPDKRALGLLLRDHGLIRPGREFCRRDLPAVIDFLRHEWFDRLSEKPSKTIKQRVDPSAGAPLAEPADTAAAAQ